MNKNNPLISIIILNYNGKDILEDCLNSVLASDYPDFEVILVDNASTDGSISSVNKIFSGFKQLKIVNNDKNYFFSTGNNIGIRQAKGEYIIILNNDTVVDKGWLKAVADKMADKSIGAGQPKIYVYDSNPLKLDYVGATINRWGYAKGIGGGEIDKGQYNDLKEIFYAGGAAMIIKRKVLDEVGLFDDKFGMHWEDADLSWRIRLKGYRIITIPDAVIYHKGSQTMSKFARRAEVAWYIRKNRIAGLIKNYGLLNLSIYLPGLLFSYLALFLKESIIGRDMRLGLSSLRAVIWNIRELPYLMEQRGLVQNKIRAVPDRDILKYMRGADV